MLLHDVVHAFAQIGKVGESPNRCDYAVCNLHAWCVHVQDPQAQHGIRLTAHPKHISHAITGTEIPEYPNEDVYTGK